MIALARAATYGEWTLRPEGERPRMADLDRPAARRVVERALERGGGWLLPDEAEELLRAARVAPPESEIAKDEETAVAAAARIGYPVTLKAAGPDILHKADVGAVRLNLGNEARVREAWRELRLRLASG